MKILVDLRSALIYDVEKVREEFISKGQYLSRLGVIRLLLKEALAMRFLVPDVVDEVTKWREEYDTMLRARGEKDYDYIDPDHAISHCESQPLNVVIDVIVNLGGVAHKREIANVLGLEENVVGQRLKKSLARKLIFRFSRGIYTTWKLDPDFVLSEENKKALLRAKAAGFNKDDGGSL